MLMPPIPLDVAEAAAMDMVELMAIEAEAEVGDMDIDDMSILIQGSVNEIVSLRVSRPSMLSSQGGKKRCHKDEEPQISANFGKEKIDI